MAKDVIMREKRGRGPHLDVFRRRVGFEGQGGRDGIFVFERAEKRGAISITQGL
jgi:hypothetical protein